MDINLDISLIIYIAAGGLILTGSAGIVLSTHLLRIIFGIALLEAGANLLLLLASYRDGTTVPIIVGGHIPAVMADPVPQALVLTSIGIDRPVSSHAPLPVRAPDVVGADANE
jgi:multicomponent Na+:H+ antiporter subunit C